jgi:hypothetical protein
MTGNVPFLMKDVVLLAVSLPPEAGRGSADPAMKSQIFIQRGDSPASAKLAGELVSNLHIGRSANPTPAAATARCHAERDSWLSANLRNTHRGGVPRFILPIKMTSLSRWPYPRSAAIQLRFAAKQ